MNILIAKAYYIKFSEALWLSTGTTLIIIKTEEAAKRNEYWKRHTRNIEKIAREVGLKKWPHTPEFLNNPQTNGCHEKTTRIYADVNKSERGMGAVVMIIVENELIAHNKFSPYDRRSKISCGESQRW